MRPPAHAESPPPFLGVYAAPVPPNPSRAPIKPPDAALSNPSPSFPWPPPPTTSTEEGRRRKKGEKKEPWKGRSGGGAAPPLCPELAREEHAAAAAGDLHRAAARTTTSPLQLCTALPRALPASPHHSITLAALEPTSRLPPFPTRLTLFVPCCRRDAERRQRASPRAPLGSALPMLVCMSLMKRRRLGHARCSHARLVCTHTPPSTSRGLGLPPCPTSPPPRTCPAHTHGHRPRAEPLALTAPWVLPRAPSWPRHHAPTLAERIHLSSALHSRRRRRAVATATPRRRGHATHTRTPHACHGRTALSQFPQTKPASHHHRDVVRAHP